jgi:hypothetical protein
MRTAGGSGAPMALTAESRYTSGFTRKFVDCVSRRPMAGDRPDEEAPLALHAPDNVQIYDDFVISSGPRVAAARRYCVGRQVATAIVMADVASASNEMNSRD